MSVIPFWMFYLCLVGVIAAGVLLNLFIYLKDFKIFTVFDDLYTYDENMEVLLPFMHEDRVRRDLTIPDVVYEIFILSFPVVTGVFFLGGALLINLLMLVDVIVQKVDRSIQRAAEGSLIYEARRLCREAHAWLSSLLRVNHRNRKGR